MKEVFISHSSENAKIANDICEALEKEDLSCWIAPRDIQVGKDYGEEIIKGIEECNVLLLCLTHASNESQHVLREVERAVNHRKTVVVYQYETVELSKSLEYFLASTQWFIPKKEGDVGKLVDTINDIQGKETEKRSEPEEKKKTTGSKKAGIFVAMAAVAVIGLATAFFYPKQQVQIAVGDTFSFGSMNLTGTDEEGVSWMILDVDSESDTVLCIAENIVAFQPYDGAESGWRGQIGETYYHEEEVDTYSDDELRKFWGSSDWETSNIRSWLNSDAAIVTYEGTGPTEDTTSLYENSYETRTGFLYSFTQEEQEKLMVRKNQTMLADGQTIETEDKVFLLSKEEAEQYFVNQNISLAAVPTESAVQMDGTGIYQSYYEEGDRTAYWGLRSYGDIGACTISCAGTGMGKTESFHSEYACGSLIGIRPAICLPIDYVEGIKADSDVQTP